MEENTVRLPLTQLQIGMVCSEDIYSSSGLLLIGRNTPINQTHLFRLKLYQIFYVSIFNNETLFEAPLTPDERRLHTEQNKTHYKCFESQYEQILDNMNVLIPDLLHGKDVCEQLYLCCKDLLLSLPTPNDIFDYLYSIEYTCEKEAILRHCLNVGLYSFVFGTWLSLDEDAKRDLTLSGLLHDLGKLQIADEIINKPGKLTEDEFNQIKEHPYMGFEQVRHSALPYSVKMSILQHHEKIDGSGYPFGFMESETHTFAKIVSILDVYDAMTSDRMYHKRFSPFSVLSILENEGYNILNHEYLSLFLENHALIYKNKVVRLSNGENGKVIFVNRKLPSRPIVQVGSSIYNLEFQLSLNIVDIVL